MHIFFFIVFRLNLLYNFRFVTHMISYFFFIYIHLILINCHSACFCNQHPVNLLLHCFLCIFIEMITDNIDCLPDFLCKCVPLCFCIHHFFHNHFFLSVLCPTERGLSLSLPEVYLYTDNISVNMGFETFYWLFFYFPKYYWKVF